MRSVRLGLLRVKDGRRRRRTVRHFTGVCHPAGSIGGRSVQRTGTWSLRAWCISAISWFPEPLTLLKRIYWFSALIGSDAPQWFYNTRWPHTWDLLAVNLKFTVLARLIGSDKFKCMRRFCRCIKQEIRRPLGAPGSPFYFDWFWFWFWFFILSLIYFLVVVRLVRFLFRLSTPSGELMPSQHLEINAVILKPFLNHLHSAAGSMIPLKEATSIREYCFHGGLYLVCSTS